VHGLPDRWVKFVRNLARAAFITLGFLLCTNVQAEPLLGEAAKSIPIFDAHLHYLEPAWGPFPPQTIIALLDKNRVALALLSSAPDEGTIMLWEHAPSRIVPELMPYHGEWGPVTWLSSPEMLGYLAERLDNYPHEAIGEFHVQAVDNTNTELLAAIAREAVRRQIPVHIHASSEPVRFFFETEPEITVIWAHAGRTTQPAKIGEMMDRYPRLYADTSLRDGDILPKSLRNGVVTPGVNINPVWESLLIRHSDRFMVGTDTWINHRWAEYDEIVGAIRTWLSQLPQSVGEKIAHGNAERLFGREAAENLLGSH
jgi:Amidohydrolase